jgi:pimeloyl-ACP methyl ester carboxylesterase
MALVLAASFPERVLGLVLYGTTARFTSTDDYPFGLPPESWAAFVELIRADWGTGAVWSLLIQNAADPDAARRLLARFERNSCTPQMAVELARHNSEIDVRPVLSTITAPTVVIHQEGDPVIPVECGRYLAEHITGARFVEGSGAFHASWRAEDLSAMRDGIREVLVAAGAPPRPPTRVLATVVFTDIVASTELTDRVGDAPGTP